MAKDEGSIEHRQYLTKEAYREVRQYQTEWNLTHLDEPNICKSKAVNKIIMEWKRYKDDRNEIP